MIYLRRAWRALQRAWRRTANRVDRHPFLTVIVAVAVVVVPGYWRLDAIAGRADTAAADAQATADATAELFSAFQLERCASRRDFAVVLRGVVERSDDPTDFQFSTLDGFDDLDEATRRLLLDLERRAASAPEPSQFVTDALALIGPIPVCGDEAPAPGTGG